MSKFKIAKITIFSTAAILFIFILFELFYLIFLPNLIKSQILINHAQKIAKNTLNLELIIQKPLLKTHFKPLIEFKVDKLCLKNKNATLVDLENFETSVSFNKILKKQIKLNYIKAQNLTLKVNEILKLIPQSGQTESKPVDFKIDFYDSKVLLDNFELSFMQNKALLELFMKDISIEKENGSEFKNVGFNFEAIVSKNNTQYLDIIASTTDEIKIRENELKIQDFDVLVNNSKLKMNAVMNLKELLVNVKSDKFFLEDIFKSINCDFVIPDGESYLAVLKNPKGNVSFDINLKNQDLSGNVTINNTKANLKDLSSLPLNIQKGKIVIYKDKIDFVDLIGYYGKNKKNSLKIYGDIKDYYKTFDSNITIDTVVCNEFFKDYLAKLINNTVMYASKPFSTRILYKAKNNIMDITWLAKIPKGVNFGVDSSDSALKNYDRAVKGDFHIQGNDLDIRNINYYIANDIHKGANIKPIIVVDGKMKLDGKIDNIGFSFAREMPCELLNVLTKDSTFKKGTIKGDLHIAFVNDIPKLDADVVISKTLIPSQKVFIKNAVLKTDNNLINIDTQGGFRRVKFDFNGKIKNELLPPFTIKNLNLALDNLDVERLLLSFNNQEQNQTQNTAKKTESVNDESDIVNDESLDFTFDTNLIRIEDCNFSLAQGKYKELTFSDIKANLTLDEKGILKINSNKFNIAQGISTLKVESDLKNFKHYVRLGVKDVDTDLLSKVLFNLEKEIQGKAMGLIELNTDKTLKMNGKIQFLVNDGMIGKIGLVEYLMKIVSVFRNPVAMINPAIVMDIVNIPEGKFDKIQGELLIKNNVIQKMDIKSYSPTLSALIRGRFDMEAHDASIRIYTRFSQSAKTKFAFLRNISLNALANKVQMNARNDANYYSSELVDLPQIDVKDENTEIFLTQVEGDIETNNFLSSLRKIK